MHAELSLIALLKRFPDDATAEAWFIEQRWPDGVRCPACDSAHIQERPTRHPQPYRCRTCRKDFSVKTDTLIHGSNLGYQTWLLALYLVTTHPKGLSSIQLGKLLGIQQRTAWYLEHRIREGWGDTQGRFAGPVEVDETAVGGLEKNKHESQKLHVGTGWAGKSIVVGLKDRATNHVQAAVIAHRDRVTLREFVTTRIVAGALLYTDEYQGYDGVPNRAFISHSAKQYVDGDVSTNGIESFWAGLKRAHKGVYHQMSPKHLPRYVHEFVGRHNQLGLPPLPRMEQLAGRLCGKRLRYGELIGTATRRAPLLGLFL